MGEKNKMQKKICIENRSVGEGKPCFIIGEIGLNHNGSIDLAKCLIDVARNAGVDAVKFQKRDVDNLAVQSVLDNSDDRFPEFGRTYREIREHLEFDEEQYRQLIDYTRSKELLFLCTAFDLGSVEFLEKLGVSSYKVASHSVTNLPLIEQLANIGKPVIISSGMCQFDELDRAMSILSEKETPTVLLHCVSSYPQGVDESNLRMISLLKERYNVPIGYSGHEIGFLPTITSVALGAVVVERHITLDTSLVGFDHKLSLVPSDLKKMVESIRLVESSFGSGEKTVSEREQITRDKYHVSIVSTRQINKGECITQEMLGLKNPGIGLPASRMDEILNKKVRREIPSGKLLELEDIG